MKLKKKRCNECGAVFFAGCREGKLYYAEKGGKVIGAYINQLLWCAKCMPKGGGGREK